MAVISQIIIRFLNAKRNGLDLTPNLSDPGDQKILEEFLRQFQDTE